MVGIVKVDTLQNNAGTSSVGMDYVVNGSAKGWMLLNCSTAAITDDFNFSSISDINTGTFTCTFGTSMANATYVTTGSGSDESAGPTVYVVHPSDTKTTSQITVRALDRTGTRYDSTKMEFAIHGDLA
jgi:hypothetical protein